MKRLRSNSGYSLIEIMAAMAVLGVLAAFAVPMLAATTSGVKLRDQAESISNLVSLAKMRATSQFTRSRVYVDLSADTYVLQLRNADGTWSNDAAVTTLPSGIDYGWGELDEPPPNAQDELAFAAACTDEDDEPIDKTACINFNSRGIPIDSDGAPIGGNAIYVTDGTGVRGITVTTTPLIRNWWSSAGNPGWIRQ